MKRYKIGKAEFCLLALILVALVLRFVLISQNWPTTNSDEATIDLMALHILTRGEHPIFFYGQAYMGSFEAYLGALSFRLFGVSLFSLRLGLLPLVALFLVSMYTLTSLLYSKKLALLVVAILAIGPGDTILHQFKAIGGYPEILLFGALIFLLSCQLVLSRQQIQSEPLQHPPSEHRKRLLRYALLGLLTGFALYTDPILAPLIATSALMLILFCQRELRSWPGLILLLAILLGLLPFILYNLQHIHDYTTFNAYIDIQKSGKLEMQLQQIPPIRMLVGAFLITLPMALGVTPVCAPTIMPLFGPTTTNTAVCVLWHGSWTLGYWLLWTLSTWLTLHILWKTWQEKRQIAFLIENPHTTKQILRLLLLLSTALSFLLYLVNPQSALDPAPTTRYLICMLIGAPALLWPLWQPFESIQPLKRSHLPYTLLLLLIGLATTASTLSIFLNLPGTNAFYQQEETLITRLRTLHATRIYTDYWTCNRIIFRSNEQILCNSLDAGLTPGQDRYPLYHQIVNAAPNPAYAFQSNSPQAKLLEQLLQQQKIPYHQSISNGYNIYQPERTIQLPHPSRETRRDGIVNRII